MGFYMESIWGFDKKIRRYDVDVKVIPDRYLWHVSDSKFYLDRERNSPEEFEGLDEFIIEEDEYGRVTFSRRDKIKKEGLKTSDNWPVFAHNRIKKLTSMYPLWLDYTERYYSIYNDKDEEDFRMLRWLKRYDFWRIDTSVFDGPWFIDPVMREDLKSIKDPYLVPSNYVCTPCDVPPESLTLFQFDSFLYEKPGFYKDSKVVSVLPRIDQWDGMYPVPESMLKVAA